MKKKSIIYIIFMVISFVLAYLFIYNGFNTLTKIYANYQEDSEVLYNVYLKNDDNAMGMNKSYIANLVNDIDIGFNYKLLFDKHINGSYSYSVNSSVVAYQDDIDDILWTKDYNELNNRVGVINRDKTEILSIKDGIKIDYDKYRDILNNFEKDSGIKISGYLLTTINIHMDLEIEGFNKQVKDDKIIKLIIPLSYDIFKINIINDNNKISSYYEFTGKDNVNYLFLVLGAICLSIGISLLALIIKEMVDIAKRESKYSKELKRILREYGDIIINVDKIYNKKKYNLIYVDSFSELLDVYNKKESPISFKEIEKNREAIFLLIEDDNAWIYRLVYNEKK